MRVIPISEVFNFEPNETVPCVQGQITNVYRQNRGTNANGDWAIQNAFLKDRSGEIKLKITDRDEIPAAWKGRTICISCNNGQKGMTGMKAKDDEYKGKVTRLISVTPTAAIEPVDPNSEDSPQDEPKSNGTSNHSREATPPPQRQPEQAQREHSHTNGNGNGHSNGNGNGEGAQAVRKSLNRMANLYLHCLVAADYVKTEWEREGGQMTPEQFQGCTSSMFIQANRDFLAAKVPTGKFSK